MTAAISQFYVHSCSVEQYLGGGAYGPVYAAPVTVPCFIDAQTTLVQNNAGQDVSQRTTVLYADISYGPLFAVLSRVTSPELGDDQTARVAKLNLLDARGLNLPDHVEATLI